MMAGRRGEGQVGDHGHHKLSGCAHSHSIATRHVDVVRVKLATLRTMGSKAHWRHGGRLEWQGSSSRPYLPLVAGVLFLKEA